MANQFARPELRDNFALVSIRYPRGFNLLLILSHVIAQVLERLSLIGTK